MTGALIHVNFVYTMNCVNVVVSYCESAFTYKSTSKLGCTYTVEYRDSAPPTLH